MSADRTRATTAPKNAAQIPLTEEEIANAAERQSNLLVLKKVAPYLWPKDMPWVKRRVVLAMLALLVSKLIIVATPFFYRDAVDALAGEGAPMLAIERTTWIAEQPITTVKSVARPGFQLLSRS